MLELGTEIGYLILVLVDIVLMYIQRRLINFSFFKSAASDSA